MTQVVPGNISNFLKTPFPQSTSGQLFLKLTSSVKYIVVFRTLSNIYDWASCKSNYLRKKAQTQQTFRRYFKVVFWFTWHRDVRQLQINVETTLPISTLEFATSNERCVFQHWYEQSIKSKKINIVRIKHYAEKKLKKATR